jgi:hypothetical protein
MPLLLSKSGNGDREEMFREYLPSSPFAREQRYCGSAVLLFLAPLLLSSSHRCIHSTG